MAHNGRDDTEMLDVKPSTGEATAEYQPTAKEYAFFHRVCMNLVGKPDVNWDKVSQECGMKDANIAKVRFQQILKKCRGGSGGVLSTPDPTTPVKKAAASRKTPVNSAAKPRAPKVTPAKKDNGADVGTIGSGTNDFPQKVKKAKTPVRKKASNMMSEFKIKEDEDEADAYMNAFQSPLVFDDEADI